MPQTDGTYLGGKLNTGTVTITNGTSLSAGTDFAGNTLVSIAFPAAWTAAVLTFQVSQDNTTWVNLYDRTGEVSFPAAANLGFQLDPALFAGWRYIKFRSGTAAAPVNQGADRILQLTTRTLY